jgi:TP901 family phage tail tape measure protein
MAAITLDIGANTRQAEKDIQKLVSRSYNINLNTKGDQPLGRITGKVNEFSKSLDASNARVIAFGASAGIIFGLERAFTALVSSTIEVQKSLQDINVILNVSAQNLQKFGAELFSIARNTGQSFQEVAKAATEFSRQGLGVEETLKRTNEALILSRLSGLDTAKSVEALTAAVNSFASQAVTATEIVNKFANVDAAFAVSSADLADAIARVGSSAAQSGVSLNELIAIVTSAQQTTARGGAVIGNSFKTIFTRLQREKVVDLLESLGISGTDSSGQVKSTIQLLTELGTVYDTLGSQQQAFVAEQVGGVFQINILKAALADLGKEYSIYGSALNVAAGATDQAIRRNEELNKTYASQINALQENARQLAAAGGERLLGPSIDRLVGGTNTLLSGFNESDGQNVGTVLGKGILDGIGQFIAGPGLALIGGVLLKLFRDLAKFATGSVQQLLGLNTAATQQRDLQASIQQILSKNPQLLELALKGEQGLNAAANSLLASLQKQTVELQKQSQIAAQISKAFVSQAGVRMTGGVPVVPAGRPGKAAGYIPNFAADDFAREELLARTLGAKNPSAQLSKGTIDGKKFIKNNREIEITNFGKNGDSAVIPNYGRGFIPNFAGVTSLYSLAKGSKIQDYKTLLTQGANYKGQFQKPFGALTKDEANQALARARTNKGQISNTQRSTITNLGKTNKISLIYGQKAGVKSVTGSFTDSNKNRYSASFASSGYNAKVEPDESNLEDLLGKQVIDFVNRFSSIFGGNSSAAKIGSIDKLANAGAFRSIAGTIFETAVTQATGSAVAQASRSGGQTAPIDYVSPNPKLRKLFNNIPGSYEAKIGDNPELVNSVADKAYRSGFFKKQGVFPGAKTKNMASGYIPNFAAIQDAINREQSAGIPKNQIYLAQEKALTSANPMGIGVFNKQDEPTKGSRKNAMRSKGFARGYVPNFAETPESGAASIGTAATAIAAQLSTLAFTFAFSKNEVKQAMTDLAKSTKNAASVQRNQLAKDIKEKRREVQSESRTSAGMGPLTKNEQKEITKQNAKTLRQDQTLTPRREAAAQNIKPGFGAKAKAFGGANAFGLAVAAPILAQTISQAIPQETRGGRIGATATGAVGNIAAGAATGFAVGGPVGAAIGAAATALLEIPNVVNSITTKVPELEKSFTQASTELTKFSDAGSRLLSSSSELKAAFAETVPSQDKINKLSEQFANALGDLSLEDQNRLKTAQKVGKLEEEYAKILSKRTIELQGKEAALALQKSAEGLNSFSGSGIAATTGSENEKLLKTTFKNLITGGAQDEKALEAVQKSATAAIPQLEKLIPRIGMETSSGDWFASSGEQNIGNELRNILNQVIPESETKADQINAILSTASQGPISLKNVIEDLINTYGDEVKSIQNVIAIRDAEKQKIAEETAAKKEAVKATNEIIDSLQRNIRAAQLMADANRAVALADKQFQRGTSFADQFTRPAETVNKIVGADAPLAKTFGLKEEIASIAFRQVEGIETQRTGLVDNINQSIKDAFAEAVTETTAQATTEGTAADIQKSNQEVLAPLASQQEKAFSVLQSVLDGVQFGEGGIGTEALLEKINQSLGEANINGKVIESITKSVKESADKGNLEIIKLRDQSVKEFKTLAKEQTQKILIAKIGQAQNFGGASVGGAIEEFINPKEPGQNVIDKVIESTQGFEQFQGKNADFRFDYMPGTDQFKYQYKEAQQARKEMAPERGRKALQLIDQLQDFTGYTPNAEGKGITAGVAGLKESIDAQIKELTNIAKTTSDPIVKEEITAALKEVNALGGTENIARLQVAQRTGALTETQFEKITGKFQSPVLEAMRQQAMALGPGEQRDALLKEIQTMSMDMLVSQDPTVNAINITNKILNQLLDVQKQAMKDAVTSEGVTPLDLTAYANEKDPAKRAAMKAGYGGITPVDVTQTTKQGVDKKVTAVQNQALPKDNRTIAEIEAKTRAKRDQKYLQSPIAPLNRTTGQKFESMQQVDAEMTKALALGAVNPEQKDYYNVLKNFKQNLNPTGGTSGRNAMFRLDDANRPVDPNSPLEIEKRTVAARDQRLMGAQNPQSKLTQPVVAQQSFTQQEAAFTNNTSALTSLAGGIESLNSTLANFEANFANLNNVPGAQPVGAQAQAGTQPGATTTTNAPVSVIVNAQGGNDIAAAVGQAVQNAIPAIIDKVKVALGQKVPPTAPNMNIK